MSLTMGTGPFGHYPNGRFNVELTPREIAYVEPSPRRMRAARAGQTVLDSTRAMMVHRHARLPQCFFPREDWRLDLLGDLQPVIPDGDLAGLAGHVTFAWAEMDSWFEEDQEIVGHAIDPYHRVDVRDTSRHVRVSLDGVVLAETEAARVVFETGLPPRWYLPRGDLRVPLRPSELHTVCAYKGDASYLSYEPAGADGENIAWSYEAPLHDAARVVAYVSFFDERVDLDVDGERRGRPRTPWAAPGWWLAGDP